MVFVNQYDLEEKNYVSEYIDISNLIDDINIKKFASLDNGDFYHGVGTDDYKILKLDNNNLFSETKLINAYSSNLGQLSDVFLGEINGNSRIIEAYSKYGFNNIVVGIITLDEISVFQTNSTRISQ